MCLIRWSAAIRIRRSASQKTVSVGLWPGRWSTWSVRSRSSIVSPSRSGRVTFAFAPPAAERAGDVLQRVDDVLGDAVAEHQRRARTRRRARRPRRSSRRTARAVERRDLGAGVVGDDVDQAEVVDVLVGEDHQLDVLDRVAELGELALELVERLARVGPGVDQRQRLVLDQVAVDAPDRERRRDRQAVDAGLGGPRQRLLGGHRGRSLTSGSAPGPRRASPPCPRGRPATRGSGAAAARCWTGAR